jgi:hypothetical protein
LALLPVSLDTLLLRLQRALLLGIRHALLLQRGAYMFFAVWGGALAYSVSGPERAT